MKKMMTEKHENVQQLLPAWREKIGLEPIISMMVGLQKSNKIPASLLLTGKEGLGKSAAASAIAAIHFCQDSSACGLCDACRRVVSGNHPEILWLEADHLGVDDIGTMQRHLLLQPSSGLSARVGVIIDADRLGVHAANRFLKILEEPPPAAKIIMTTSKVDNLLPTVRSRCVRFHLRPPPVQQTKDFLNKKAQEWQQDLAADNLQRILKLSGMAPGKALSLLEHQQGVAKQTLHFPLGARDVGEVLAAAEKYAKQKDWSLRDILAQFEISINRVYWEGRGGESNYKLRRRLLSQARDLVDKKKITLNTQLMLDGLLVASVDRSQLKMAGWT